MIQKSDLFFFHKVSYKIKNTLCTSLYFRFGIWSFYLFFRRDCADLKKYTFKRHQEKKKSITSWKKNPTRNKSDFVLTVITVWAFSTTKQLNTKQLAGSQLWRIPDCLADAWTRKQQEVSFEKINKWKLSDFGYANADKKLEASHHDSVAPSLRCYPAWWMFGRFTQISAASSIALHPVMEVAQRLGTASALYRAALIREETSGGDIQLARTHRHTPVTSFHTNRAGQQIKWQRIRFPYCKAARQATKSQRTQPDIFVLFLAFAKNKTVLVSLQ